ncbi:MAG: helix-turn-helix domain-containing protein [Halobacteriota archaeon]
MGRDRFGSDEPDFEVVVGALEDDIARTIITNLSEPMTASTVSDVCDIPLSTTYRKLDLLTDATLLNERTALRSDGHHATLYEVDFESVTIELTESLDLSASVSHPERTADERLASLWAEVRKET